MREHNFFNWRIIIETEYISMFIKTWFAFLATLQKIYPYVYERLINEKRGDKEFIDKYKNDCIDKIDIVNNQKLIENIKNMYSISKKYIKEKHESEYFYRFFEIENGYSFSTANYIDKTEMKIKKIKDNKISIIIKHDTKKFEAYFGNYLSFEYDYKEDISKFKENYFFDIINEIRNDFLEWIINDKIKSNTRLSQNGINERKEFITKIINENFQVLRTQSLADKKFLFNQIPQENFPEENNQHAKILLWSLEYIYWLRNLLFHSIINPFDKDLNNLFKYAYFTLQDIVDDNIKWINKKDEEALR